MTDTVDQTPDEPQELPLARPAYRHVSRVVLAAFILTFVAARGVVVLIMARVVPDLFLHVGSAHVHHLNYGIFLLSGVGAYLLFRRPGSGWRLTWASIAYGVGMGLTFDEFGMWVHLGGSYWQRASFDACTVIAAAFGLLAYAPPPSKFRSQHWAWTAVLSVTVVVFVSILALSVSRYATRLGPWLKAIESTGPQ